MANAIPVQSSNGKEPTKAAPAEEVKAEGAVWTDGLTPATIAAVTALGGPEDDRAKALLAQMAAMEAIASNPMPVAGRIRKTTELLNASDKVYAVRHDF